VRIYPAIKARMGDWTSYMLRMHMREVADDIRLAQDIDKGRTLSDAIQRELGARRVKKDLVGYLARRPDRFFPSIVVAAIKGEPHWHPVEMDSETVPSVFSASRSLADSFGVLSFGDEPRYYALDGQHRVAAIRLLVNREAELAPPVGFEDDYLSVIVVVREEHDELADDDWLRRYRRLFSSLNRWAKKTDQDTNIIMDEDDLFAILTRRLITDHEFFISTAERQRDSFRVLTKGKNLRTGQGHLTTLQTLYGMTRELLASADRRNRGWGLPDAEKLDLQIRPHEAFIDACYEELAAYWDAILEAMPVLREDPIDMRHHNAADGEERQDHLLFWPIGQELFAREVRTCFDRSFYEDSRPSHEELVAALKPFARMPWDLHQPPWKHLLLVRGPRGWIMRNESRNEAIRLAGRLVSWLVGMEELDVEGAQELRDDWGALLLPPPEDTASMWGQIEQAREDCLSDL